MKIAVPRVNSAVPRALRALGRIEPRFGAEPVDGSLVHWNTTYLDRAVQHLRAQGVVISNELLSHVAPLGWEHIALTPRACSPGRSGPNYAADYDFGGAADDGKTTGDDDGGGGG